jgi:hypothetical protein
MLGILSQANIGDNNSLRMQITDNNAVFRSMPWYASLCGVVRVCGSDTMSKVSRNLLILWWAVLGSNQWPLPCEGRFYFYLFVGNYII